MSLPSSDFRSAPGPSPTCYIQTLATGECATVPTAFGATLRGVVPTGFGPGILPGAVCGWASTNAHLPCVGGYCSNEMLGKCMTTNALNDGRVNLFYYQ